MGLTAVWVAQVGYRALQSLVFAFIWRGRSWIDVRV
jgi:hypothetical protein